MTVQEIDDTFAAYDKAVLAGTANTKEWDTRMKDAQAALKGYNDEMRASLVALGSSVASLGKSLADGETGAAVFGGVLTAGSDTLSTFAKKGGPAVQAFALVIKAGAAYVGAVLKQSDALYKSFQDVSRAGTIGVGGMTEVYSSMQRLGYGIKELDKFGTLMKENSKDLAIFGGTATSGSKALVGLGNDLQHTGITRDLLMMGLSVDEINKGATGYIKQQISLGQGRKDIGDKLSDGAVSYIKEMEMMSRLTGQTRQEQQNKINAANEQQAWNAKMRQLEKQEKAGDQQAGRKRIALQRTMLMLEGDMQQQFIKGVGEDISGLGPLAIVGGQRLVDAIQDPAATEEEMLTAITEGYKNISEAGGETLQKFNAFDDSLGKTIEYETLMSKLDKNKVSDLVEKAKLDTKAADKATSHVVDMEIAQRKARDNLQDFVNLGIDPVTKAVEILSKVIEWITDFLPGVGKSRRDREMQKQVDAIKTTKVGVWNKDGNMVYVSPDEAKKIKSGEMKAPEKSTVSEPGSPSVSEGKGWDDDTAGGKGLTGKGINGLEKSFADAIRNAADEYFSLTGKQVRVESALRDSAKQKELYDAYKAGKSKFPAAPPGTSKHEKGLAVDVDLAAANDMDAKGILGKYGLNRPVAGDPIHISAKDGFDGTLTGPTSGYQPQITMHGTEALKIEPLGETTEPFEQQNDDEKNKMLTIQLESLDTLYRSLVKQNDYSNKILQQTS